MWKLRRRLLNHTQITTNGYRGFLPAVENGFGTYVYYTMLVKFYGKKAGDEHTYSPPKVLEVVSTVIQGNPNVSIYSLHLAIRTR
jgi:hypothetical protein